MLLSHVGLVSVPHQHILVHINHTRVQTIRNASRLVLLHHINNRHNITNIIVECPTHTEPLKLMSFVLNEPFLKKQLN